MRSIRRSLAAALPRDHTDPMTGDAPTPAGAPERDIILKGASNLRDLGGYATRCGRSVRWRRLYRSGELVRIDDAGCRTIAGLDLAVIYDLRSDQERAARPGRVLGTARPVRRHRAYTHSGADLPALMATPDVDARAVRRMMLDLYRDLPVEQAGSTREILSLIAEGNVPLLFHCAGGKDRTGALAAIILDLLGVARSDIMVDYLRTNRFLDAGRRRFLARFGREDVDPQVWEPMLAVEAAYLDTLFEAIDGRHGGVGAYLRAIGLPNDAAAAIRNVMLADSRDGRGPDAT